MIPQEYSEAVTRSLNETFGLTEIEDIRDLAERPDSNRAFRIVIRGSAYLLRINTRRGDTKHHFACMQAAADAGLAPRVWYASAEDRISITDFVEAVPLPAAEALVRIPATLRNLHTLSPFPTSPFNTTCTFLLHEGPALAGFLERFRTASILPEGDTQELLARYEQVAAAYSRLEADLAPSHNDLFKPDNMLFDGDRLWLVDWEAAFQNDRYVDLAVVANMIVTDEPQEAIYLQGYFGKPPDDYQRARFYLMRQLAHMFYAMAFLTPGPPGAPIEESEPVPAYVDFQRRFWAREVGLPDARARTVFGRVHWEQLSQNMRQKRFDEALRIVAERNAIEEGVSAAMAHEKPGELADDKKRSSAPLPPVPNP